MDESGKTSKVLLILTAIYGILGILPFIIDSSDTTWVGLGIMSLLGAAYLFYRYLTAKQKEEEQEEAAQLAKEKIDKFNQAGKEHKWAFPAEKFFRQCSDASITKISSEFEFGKAKSIAEQLIREECPKADMSCFQAYLTKEKLQEFLDAGKPLAELTAKKELAQKKQVRFAKAYPYEATFIKRNSGIQIDRK